VARPKKNKQNEEAPVVEPIEQTAKDIVREAEEDTLEAPPRPYSPCVRIDH